MSPVVSVLNDLTFDLQGEPAPTKLYLKGAFLFAEVKGWVSDFIVTQTVDQ
jgi:hypothetical protein